MVIDATASVFHKQALGGSTQRAPSIDLVPHVDNHQLEHQRLTCVRVRDSRTQSVLL